jgi:SAM-dependent methyltransferase
MNIDYERVRQIIETADRTYYGREACKFEKALAPTGQIDDVFGRVCRPGSRVLDIGCGNIRTLIRNARLFGEGVGLDNDPRMQALAQRSLAEAGVRNVRFVLGRADNLPFERESFDFVFSERGPLAWSDVNTFNAVRALREGGTILAESPWTFAGREAGYIFDANRVPFKDAVHGEALDKLAAVLRHSGIDVQFACCILEEWVFADFYEWLKFHFSCWEYDKDRRIECWPLSEELRHSIDRFVVMTGDDDGGIHITAERLWAGGIKR